MGVPRSSHVPRQILTAERRSERFSRIAGKPAAPPLQAVWFKETDQIKQTAIYMITVCGKRRNSAASTLWLYISNSNIVTRLQSLPRTSFGSYNFLLKKKRIEDLSEFVLIVGLQPCDRGAPVRVEAARAGWKLAEYSANYQPAMRCIHPS